MKFNELNLDKRILNALNDLEFSEMSDIQSKSIPVILENNNVIGEAKTGSGKTLAFIIPILNKMDLNSKSIEHVIITPTRELALQIIDQFKKIGKYYKFDVVGLVGGMSIEEQSKKLRAKPNVIVATPGRLIDHLERNRLTLNNLKTFVIDEVDEMFKSGFMDDINKIFEYTNEDKQLLFFSATISKNVLNVVKNMAKTYEYISVIDHKDTKSNITQYAMVVKERDKFKTLVNLLDLHSPLLSIIFVRTKRRADELVDALNTCGYKALCIHGDLSQSQRNNVINKFKNKEAKILVATDVVARGIDINDITHVYNFDLPQEVEFYTHRIGRTGRANNVGESYSFSRDVELLHIDRIQKETNCKINTIKVPTSKDISTKYIENLEANINNHVESNSNEYKDIVNKLVEEYDASAIASYLVSLTIEKKDVNKISLTGEPPVKVRNKGNSNRSEGGRRSSRFEGNRRSNRNDENRRSNRNDENRRTNRNSENKRPNRSDDNKNSNNNKFFVQKRKRENKSYDKHQN